MIVVLIIGIIVTFAALSLGSRTVADQLETEAERLHQLLAIAAEDAEVQGIELGWRYTSDGYEFLTLNDAGEWVQFGGVLHERGLPQPLYIDLAVEGRAVAPSSPADKPGTAAGAAALQRRSQRVPPRSARHQLPALHQSSR